MERGRADERGKRIGKKGINEGRCEGEKRDDRKRLKRRERMSSVSLIIYQSNSLFKQ